MNDQPGPSGASRMRFEAADDGSSAVSNEQPGPSGASRIRLEAADDGSSADLDRTSSSAGGLSLPPPLDCEFIAKEMFSVVKESPMLDSPVKMLESVAQWIYDFAVPVDQWHCVASKIDRKEFKWTKVWRSCIKFCCNCRRY